MVTARISQLVLIFTSFFSVGLCIKCFQCNSAEDPECESLKTNDTNSRFYGNCSGVPDGHVPFCRKLFIKVVDLEDSTRVLRTCGWIQAKNQSADHCKKGDTDFIKKVYCQCYSDACNDSDRMHASVTMSTRSVLITVLFYVFCNF